MPNARHNMILKLIQTHEVSTQEMLRDLLEENGFSVTQATISRDIRQLKLRKHRTASGVSCYAKTPSAAIAPNTLQAMRAKPSGWRRSRSRSGKAVRQRNGAKGR